MPPPLEMELRNSITTQQPKVPNSLAFTPEGTHLFSPGGEGYGRGVGGGHPLHGKHMHVTCMSHACDNIELTIRPSFIAIKE